jgi:hypothetical protein
MIDEKELAKMQAYLGPCFLLYGKKNKEDTSPQQMLIPIFTIIGMEGDGTILKLTLRNKASVCFRPEIPIKELTDNLNYNIGLIKQELEQKPEALPIISKNCMSYINSEFPYKEYENDNQ